MDHKNYFEEIGAWPRGSHHIARAYVAGFILSLVLTFVAYFLAAAHLLTFDAATAIIIVLALVQCFVQLICFLHLGAEKDSRDRLLALGATAIIILIVVVGSVWIMINLNGRMMPTSAQMEQYMNEQMGF